MYIYAACGGYIVNVVSSSPGGLFFFKYVCQTVFCKRRIYAVLSAFQRKCTRRIKCNEKI